MSWAEPLGNRTWAIEPLTVSAICWLNSSSLPARPWSMCPPPSPRVRVLAAGRSDKNVARAVPPGVDTFLLTSLRDLAAIVEQCERVRRTTLQLVDRIDQDVLRELRREVPGARLAQVVHVTGPEVVVQARAVEPLVDAVLLDSGRPHRAGGPLGGTGC